jgi:hypothetical protein
MEIVSVYQLQGNMDQLAQSLADALRITPYEARSRINGSSGGPTIVATFATSEQATHCVARLNDFGFKTLKIEPCQIESDKNRFFVRTLQFLADRLHLVTQENRALDIPYHDVKLLLRGAGIVTHTQVESNTKKKFALGRAVATGGLVRNKKVKSATQNHNQERQPFCHIYAQGQGPIVLRQADIDYTGLGVNRQLSRDANFNWICTELRNRCNAADWDDRLKTRPGLAQVLGPAFDPESDLDMAITLVRLAQRAKG